jgi:hypothetical protein
VGTLARSGKIANWQITVPAKRDERAVNLFLDQVGVAGEQRRAFEHPAEILFAGVAVLAGVTLEALESFVADFQPLQLHDAHKLLAAFPSLALLKFHVSTVVFNGFGGEQFFPAKRKNVTPSPASRLE